MRKADIFCQVTTIQTVFQVCLLLLTGYADFSFAKGNEANKGFVTVSEHEKLKREMATLKKQMATLVKNSSASSTKQSESTSSSTVSQAKPAQKTKAKSKSADVAEKESANASPPTSNGQDANKSEHGMALAEGDRKKEAAEAKRQMDVFLRSQKLLFKKGELQTELDLIYSKSSSGNQILRTNPAQVPIDSQRSVAANAIARYGLYDNLEFDLTLPFSYAEQDLIQNALAGESSHFERTGLGDLNLGLRYAAWREDGTLPDVIVSVNSTAPTNDDKQFGASIWNIGTSTTLVKTFDPVVLFGSLGYATNIGDSNQPGSDQLPYSMGMGFSLNDRISFSMSMSGTSMLNRNTGNTYKSSNGGNIMLDSKGNPIRDKGFTYGSSDFNTMQFSSTIQVIKNLSVEPFVSFGLTDESQDLAVGVRLPYRLDGKFPLPF